MTETQTLNEETQDFYIGEKKYTHTLLNYYYYNKFIERLNYILLKLNVIFGKDEPWISRNPLKFNKQAWVDRLSDERLIYVFYELFVLAFYNRKYYYEDIFITDANGHSNIFAYFIIKPIMFIMDKFNSIVKSRVKFRQFIKEHQRVELLKCFIDIMKTQVDIDDKKKTYAMLQKAEDQYFQVSRLFMCEHSPVNGKTDNTVPFPIISKEGYTELLDPSTIERPSKSGS